LTALATIQAMSNPIRFAILDLVSEREMGAGEIALRFKTTRPAVSQHLRVLTDAGLVTERREGTKRFYSLRPEGFRGLREFLDLFWDFKLDCLKTEVEKEARSRRGR